MKKRDNRKSKLTTMDRFWINVVHPEVKDKDDNYIPQGYAEISVEILPKAAATEKNNGMGRDQPNQFPMMPEPTGRFKFVAFVSNNFLSIGFVLSLENDKGIIGAISSQEDCLLHLLHHFLLSFHLLGLFLWREPYCQRSNQRNNVISRIFI